MYIVIISIWAPMSHTVYIVYGHVGVPIIQIDVKDILSAYNPYNPSPFSVNKLTVKPFISE